MPWNSVVTSPVATVFPLKEKAITASSLAGSLLLFSEHIVDFKYRLAELQGILLGVICSAKVPINIGDDEIAVFDHPPIPLRNGRFGMNPSEYIGNNNIIIGELIVFFIGVQFIGKIGFDKDKFNMRVFPFQTTNGRSETSVKVSHPTRPKLRNPLG